VGTVSAKTLKGMDIVVRTAVRRWLRFPHDVPAGYFHAPIQSGGLGMPLLKTLIPILKYNRLRRLCQSTLPAARAAAETTFVARQLVWCENQVRVRGNRVMTTAELRQHCAAWLRESCDGNGLREAETSAKLSLYWVAPTPFPEPTTCTITTYGLSASRLEREYLEVVKGAMFTVALVVSKSRRRRTTFSDASERTEGEFCDITTYVVKSATSYNRRDGKWMRN